MPGARRNVDAFGLAVARILKSHYEGRGESLRVIAPKIGVHFTQVGRFMNGVKPMTLDEFALICEALNVDPVRVLEAAEQLLEDQIDDTPIPFPRAYYGDDAGDMTADDDAERYAANEPEINFRDEQEQQAELP